MAEHIAEQITLNLVAALKTITVEDGYTFDVSSVERPVQDDIIPANWKIVIGLRDGEENEEKSAYPMTMSRLGYVVIVFVPPEEAADVVPETLAWRIHGDICKCLMTDPTRGGLADGGKGTKVRFPEQHDDGVAVPVDVYTRWLWTDPTKKNP